MKLEVKKVDSIKREMKFEIPKDRVKQTFDEVYQDIAKSAKIKGFRQGKVPRHILEKSYAKEAQEEMIRKIIPEAYTEGLTKEKLSPIDMPQIEDVNYKDGIVTFTAKLELKPEINVKDYKGIKVKRKDSSVTEEEITKTLDYFKQGQGADKKVEINDAFAKGLGYPSLEDFKKSLVRQMEMDKDRQNRADVENQLIETLFKSTKFDVPSSLVQKQLARRIEEQAHQLTHQGVPAAEAKKSVEASKAELEKQVEKDIKVYLILDKIAQEEKMEIKEGESLPSKVMEFLFKEAQWS